MVWFSSIRLLLVCGCLFKVCHPFSTVKVNRKVPASLSTLQVSTSSSIDVTSTVAPAPNTQRDDTLPQTHYDTIISGGGPAGLLTAIMLSQKMGPSHRIALVERRPALPAHPSNTTLWNDVARFYCLGIGHRGQRALQEFGVFDDFVNASVAVNGRRDWQPGQTKVEDGRITPAKKDVVSRILARDKLVGVLYHHLVDNYVENKEKANIDLLYGYEVNPTDFGKSSQDMVSVMITKCEEDDATTNSNAAESDPLCDVEQSTLATTNLLIGADGSARTVANAMEQADHQRRQQLNPLGRIFAKRPFRVVRFEDDNPRVYKSVPIKLPADWPHDLNYSARSRENRITLEGLPSDDQGNLCALLLMKPGDSLAQANVPPNELRSFFDKEFPQFSALISDDEMARVATKPVSALPAFRYAGPRLNLGQRTLVLGDAAHTVKPYYGLGANSALEDVQILAKAIDDAKTMDSVDDDANAIIPRAVQIFSKRRSADSKALVTISRNMDRPGKLFYVNFLIPLILDGMFHKFAPAIFSPNMFGMFQKQDMGFRQIQLKKRLDRVLQLTVIASLLTGAGLGLKAMIGLLARLSGKSRPVVTLSLGLTIAIASVLQKSLTSRKKKANQ